ncbi:MAG: hypothetical protein C5B51_31835 [Terriglobia bacterium]|nr:MAG: hypothetical protein C5B51_31835 [Terriglobia bacterium]
MSSATIDEVCASAATQPERPKPTRKKVFLRTRSTQEDEAEVNDFIARCVLEKDAEFFDG